MQCYVERSAANVKVDEHTSELSFYVPCYRGLSVGPPLKYTILKTQRAPWTPHLEITAKSAQLLPEGWTPGEQLALGGPTGGGGGQGAR